MMRRILWLALYAGLQACIVASRAHAQTVLDDFESMDSWHVVVSDDVKATLRRAAGKTGKALCMDFDFGTVSGYASMRRELPVDYPSNFEYSFDVRGDTPPAALQFKLVDQSGENVWWVNRPDFAFPRNWREVRLRKRQVSFAWGPTPDRELRHSAQIEFVVARGRHGSKGSFCVDRLSIRELPPVDSTSAPEIQASASSSTPSGAPARVLDGAPDTAWHSNPASGPDQMLILDFGRVREFGGLVLHWLPRMHASRYTVDLSDDAKQWQTIRSVRDGNGGTDALMLPESEARFVRLHLRDGPSKSYALGEVNVQDPAYGESANTFVASIARDAPRGYYPRAFVGEQNYWTVLGIDGGTVQALLSEDGAIEFSPGSPSVEPFLVTEDGVLTWADVQIGQSLRDGYLPVPTVQWKRDDLTLDITAFAIGSRAKSQVVAQYTVTNGSDKASNVTLAIAARPFQVNPPTQFLNVAGGVSQIHTLTWKGRAFGIDGRPRLYALQKPERFVAADFDAGELVDLIAAAHATPGAGIKDESGFASGALLYRMKLAPHAQSTVGIVIPLSGPATLPAGDVAAWLAQEQNRAADQWRERLNRVVIRVPPQGRALVDTVRSALAHILIDREGPALRPGTRSYARSWIRDGSMMSAALLRMGHADVVRDYADWYAPRQFSSGKIPCCVDARGADPVAENDSQGEWIYMLAAYHRFIGDRAWLKGKWPGVEQAVAYMNRLSASERTPQNEVSGRRAFYGLMPASISHEGYSDRPAYSYWDDFWSLAGYDGAVDIGRALDASAADRIANERDEFRGGLHESIETTMLEHGIDYIPASADRGDFDPTATTVALSVAADQARLPQAALLRTFERYWEGFVERRDNDKAWKEFTPYELRAVGAFIRLGWRERAVQLLDYFLGYRRPTAWNQWAEVAGRDAREPRFIGDMPHAWIASDFIQSALDMFAYDRPQDESLVINAGLPAEWLGGSGISIDNLRTPHGSLAYAARCQRNHLRVYVPAGPALPAGGLVFSAPEALTPGTTLVNGTVAEWEGHELRIHALPAAIDAVIANDLPSCRAAEKPGNRIGK